MSYSKEICKNNRYLYNKILTNSFKLKKIIKIIKKKI